MKLHISQTETDALTTEDLLAEIAGFNVLAIDVVKRLSLILQTLRKRRVSNAFFRHPVLNFWQSITNHTLDPEAAILLANRDMIKAVIPLTAVDQVRIAKGDTVPTMVMDTKTGTATRIDTTIFLMDTATLKRVFGPDGIRSLADQTEILRAEGKIKRHGMITVLRDEGLLKIGNGKIRPEDLRVPLLALGYTMTLTRNNETAPPSRAPLRGTLPGQRV